MKLRLPILLFLLSSLSVLFAYQLMPEPANVNGDT